jgi:hypothetical protein
MPEALKRILGTEIVKRVEEYDWRGRSYLRVFVKGQVEAVWDGPKTPEVSKFINATHNWELLQKKKGTR